MGARRGRLSAPWLRFHGGGAADVYIIIRVRASGCGESALNPPTSPPIPRRRPSPATAQRHALPLPSCHIPAAQTHTRRPHNTFPVEDLFPPPHSDTPFPSTSAPPRSADARPQATPCIPRRPHDPFPAEGLLPPQHSDALFPSTFAPPRSADARPPTSQPIPRRRPSPAPAAPPCLPLRSASGTKKRHRTVDVRCRMSRSTVVAVGHWGW